MCCPVVSRVDVSILRCLIQVPFGHVFKRVKLVDTFQYVTFGILSYVCENVRELRPTLYRILERRLS